MGEKNLADFETDVPLALRVERAMTEEFGSWMKSRLVMSDLDRVKLLLVECDLLPQNRTVEDYLANTPKYKGFLHIVHHKTGTHWSKYVLRDTLKKYGIDFREGSFCQLLTLRSDKKTWFMLHGHSPVIQEVLHYFVDVMGQVSHMIRDPRDVLISGYFYHKKAPEGWIKQKGILETYSNEEGILFELDNGWFTNYMECLMMWNVTDSRFLTYRYEDLWSSGGRFWRGVFEGTFLPATTTMPTTASHSFVETLVSRRVACASLCFLV